MHLPRTGSCENNSLDVGDPRPPQRSRSYDPDFRAPSAKVMCNFDITFSLPDVSLVCLHFLLFPKDKQKRKFKRNLRENTLSLYLFFPFICSPDFFVLLCFSHEYKVFFFRGVFWFLEAHVSEICGAKILKNYKQTKTRDGGVKKTKVSHMWVLGSFWAHSFLNHFSRMPRSQVTLQKGKRGWTGEGREGKERAQYYFCFLLLPTPLYTSTTYQIQNVFYVVCITAFKNFDGGMV